MFLVKGRIFPHLLCDQVACDGGDHIGLSAGTFISIRQHLGALRRIQQIDGFAELLHFSDTDMGIDQLFDPGLVGGLNKKSWGMPSLAW